MRHLGASQVRRRLKGHGYGVRKVYTDGKNRAVIIHTATGDHLPSFRTYSRRQPRARNNTRTETAQLPERAPTSQR